MSPLVIDINCLLACRKAITRCNAMAYAADPEKKSPSGIRFRLFRYPLNDFLQRLFRILSDSIRFPRKTMTAKAELTSPQRFGFRDSVSCDSVSCDSVSCDSVSCDSVSCDSLDARSGLQPVLTQRRWSNFNYAFTRSTYSPVRVSTRMTSPSLINAGATNSAPVSTFTGLVTFVAVSPLAPGSQYSTVNST